MKQYRVTWVIEVWAESAKEAAYQARDMQTRNDTTATVFDVEDRDTGNQVQIDLFNDAIDV